MAIRGSLREASLPDVLQLLSMGRKTGCLSLTHRSNFGYIYFESGLLTYASIVNRRDRIGERLLQAGLITHDVLQDAVDAQQMHGEMRIGDVLVARGAITRAVLHDHVRVQVEETVYLLYTWNEGTFNFEPGARPPNQDSLVSINPQSLLLEGARRVDEWTIIGQSVPSFDLVFEVDRAALDASGMLLNDDQLGVVQSLDGTRDVSHVAEKLGVAEFDVGKVLHELLKAGVVRRAGRRSRELQAVPAARTDEHRNLGVAFYRTAMFDEAAREFRRVLELSPEDLQARACLALVLMRQSKWAEAVDAYQQLAALPEARASVFHNLAIALERLGRYTDAHAALQQAADRDGGDDPRVVTSLGASALLMGDPEAADRAFAVARKRFKSHPTASWYHYAALAAAWLGDLPRAQSLLEEGIGHHPHTAALHNNLAATLERRASYNEALAAAERGKHEDHTLPQLHKNTGDLYYRVARYDDALAAYERAIQHDATLGADVYLKLGNIRLRRQQRDEAGAHWRRALELDPANAIVRKNLSAIGALP
jgi:tetratricopeptide (TPR) repeat protein